MKKFPIPIWKKTIRRFGIDIVRYAPRAADRAKAIDPRQKGANLLKALTLHKIDLIFDIGANVGQFAHHMFEIGYEGSIVSFEPITAAREQLLTASQTCSNWSVAEQCALGDRDTRIDINVAEDTKKSSILSILPTYLDLAPNATFIRAETVPMRQFSACFEQYRGDAQAPFLKINVQGFEDRVLQGAEAVLGQLKGIHIEFSFVPLYEQQVLFNTLFEHIQLQGFTLYNLYPSFSDYRTGKIIKAVGIFFRETDAG